MLAAENRRSIDQDQCMTGHNVLQNLVVAIVAHAPSR
jgi:hypothetical protein